MSNNNIGVGSLGADGIKQVFVAWTSFQRRQVSMAPHCGFELLFLPVERRVGKVRKALAYIGNGFKTLSVLIREKPSVVWIQLPQVPLMWIALLYRVFFRRDVAIVADCHNSMFRPPWSKVPFGLSLLSRCNVVVVHNEDVLETAVGLGVERCVLTVVEDPPASFPGAGQFSGLTEVPHPWFVFPASFAQDEPIYELIEAARLTPEVSVLITGNTRNCREPALIKSAPQNVHFLGFLSREDFEALIVSCEGVIAFTRFDGIQLSVCGEAVGAEKPMLISDTRTLRRQYPKGTVFVDSSDHVDISNGLRDVLKRREQLCSEMTLFHSHLVDRWKIIRGEPLMERINLSM